MRGAIGLRTALAAVMVAALPSASCRPVPAAGLDASAAASGGADAASASLLVPDASSSSPEEGARKIVAAWSDALDRHDLAALDRLYAPRVKFYGKDAPKSAVVDAKRRALGPASTFHQSIVGAIDVIRDGDAFAATFLKRSGGSRVSDVKARIVVVDHLVREESDAPSDTREKREGRGSGCEATASAAVSGLPRVKKVLDDDARELEGKNDGRSMGGLGPIPDDEGGFSASLGVHHSDRYEAQVSYTVDRAGRLSVTIRGEDLPVSSATRSAVERACKAP